MLSAIVVESFAPLGGLSGLSGYTEAEPAPASCRPADFRCGPRGGIHSCRPCDFPQLTAFADFQHLLNRLIAINGIDPKHEIPVSEDGRIGPKTATTAGVVAAAIQDKVPPDATLMSALQAAISAPNSPSTHRALSLAMPELLVYLKRAANQLGAPEVPRRDLAPAAMEQPGTAAIPQAKSKKAIVWGLLLGAAALGLVGYAATREEG